MRHHSHHRELFKLFKAPQTRLTLSFSSITGSSFAVGKCDTLFQTIPLAKHERQVGWCNYGETCDSHGLPDCVTFISQQGQWLLTGILSVMLISLTSLEQASPAPLSLPEAVTKAGAVKHILLNRLNHIFLNFQLMCKKERWYFKD